MADTSGDQNPNKAKVEGGKVEERPVCGVVRPIAGIEGYPEGHWLEVHQIITEAADIAGYDARLVSDDEAIGVILGRIVGNLHDHPVVVVDVSGLNPNVFFELGMRLTFDKPTVVIKDDATRYPFDASPIEYIPYPSSLRHAPLMAFKEKLVKAIAKTAATINDQNYRSFLKHFGSPTPGSLGEPQTLSTALVLEEIRSLKTLIKRPQVDKVVDATVRKRVSDQWTSVVFDIDLAADKVPIFRELLNTQFGKGNVVVNRESDTRCGVHVAYNPRVYSPETVQHVTMNLASAI